MPSQFESLKNKNMAEQDIRRERKKARIPACVPNSPYGSKKSRMSKPVSLRRTTQAACHEFGCAVCPSRSCKNNWGRGFKDLQGHLERQHSMELKNWKGHQREILLQAIKKLNRVICLKCHRIRGSADQDGVCTSSWKRSIQEEIIENLSLKEQHDILDRIIEANRTIMLIVKNIPRTLRQWWSKAVTVTLHQWLQIRQQARLYMQSSDSVS